MSFKTPKSISIYQSPTIDFKTTGTTPIFTTESSGSFIALQIIFILDVVDTFTVPGIYNIGWTAPDYDDFISSKAIGSFTASSTFAAATTGPINIFIPASTQVIFNITTVVTATTCTGSVIFVGFYI